MMAIEKQARVVYSPHIDHLYGGDREEQKGLWECMSVSVCEGSSRVRAADASYICGTWESIRFVGWLVGTPFVHCILGLLVSAQHSISPAGVSGGVNVIACRNRMARMSVSLYWLVGSVDLVLFLSFHWPNPPSCSPRPGNIEKTEKVL